MRTLEKPESVSAPVVKTPLLFATSCVPAVTVVVPVTVIALVVESVVELIVRLATVSARLALLMMPPFTVMEAVSAICSATDQVSVPAVIRMLPPMAFTPVGLLSVRVPPLTVVRPVKVLALRPLICWAPTKGTERPPGPVIVPVRVTALLRTMMPLSVMLRASVPAPSKRRVPAAPTVMGPALLVPEVARARVPPPRC
jgi:hypothetical protein